MSPPPFLGSRRSASSGGSARGRSPPRMGSNVPRAWPCGERSEGFCAAQRRKRNGMQAGGRVPDPAPGRWGLSPPPFPGIMEPTYFCQGEFDYEHPHGTRHHGRDRRPGGPPLGRSDPAEPGELPNRRPAPAPGDHHRLRLAEGGLRPGQCRLRQADGGAGRGHLRRVPGDPGGEVG